jgi:hypothetical protein
MEAIRELINEMEALKKTKLYENSFKAIDDCINLAYSKISEKEFTKISYLNQTNCSVRLHNCIIKYLNKHCNYDYKYCDVVSIDDLRSLTINKQKFFKIYSVGKDTLKELELICLNFNIELI